MSERTWGLADYVAVRSGPGECGIQCPQCGERLVPRTHDGVAFLQCTGCGQIEPVRRRAPTAEEAGDGTEEPAPPLTVRDLRAVIARMEQGGSTLSAEAARLAPQVAVRDVRAWLRAQLVAHLGDKAFKALMLVSRERYLAARRGVPNPWGNRRKP